MPYLGVNAYDTVHFVYSVKATMYPLTFNRDNDYEFVMILFILILVAYYDGATVFIVLCHFMLAFNSDVVKAFLEEGGRKEGLIVFGGLHSLLGCQLLILLLQTPTFDILV